MARKSKRTHLTRSQLLRRRVKNFLHSLTGRDVFFRIEVKCQREPHGKLIGGWQICPETLSAQPVIYSLGVGFDLSFDESILRTYAGAELHAFDPTPASIDWVAEQELESRLHFHPYGVAETDGRLTLHAPHKANLSFSMVERRNPLSESVEVPVRKLSGIMQELGHPRIDILKMDIEGAEYGVIREMLANGIRPGQVLVEFHHRFEGVGNAATRGAVRDLRQAGYRIFYVSHTAREYGFILESELIARRRAVKVQRGQ